MKKVFEWPYWVLGGMISLVALSVLLCVIALAPLSVCEGPLGLIWFAISIPAIILSAHMGFLTDAIFNSGSGYGVYAVFLFYYFLIGAFSGRIVGKFKK
ncbi:MAG: hypothetical protein V1867_08015 [Candidatus Falkowbacteria bacterium]